MTSLAKILPDNCFISCLYIICVRMFLVIYMKKKKLRLKKPIIRFLYLLLVIMIVTGGYLLTNGKKEPPKPKKETTKTVKASFIGDLLYEQPYYDWIGSNYDDHGYYDLVKPYFKNDDFTLANMEVPIGGKELGISGSGYQFNAPNEIGQQVIDMGVDVLTLANNHANDAGRLGQINTLKFFKDRKVLTTGVYDSVKQRKQIPTKTINDITFSFLGYTYKTNKLNKDNQDLIGYYRNLDTMKLDQQHKDIIKEEVSLAKKKSNVVIVSVHWGDEFTYNINDEQKELANYLSELGVDVVIGHHSHCIQPLEWIDDTLVIYSLGSFVSADPLVKRASTEFSNAYNVSMILQVQFVKKKNDIKIKNVNYVPIINYYDQNLQNFKLVPLDQYTTKLEQNHYRYHNGLTKDFIVNSFKQVMKDN